MKKQFHVMMKNKEKVMWQAMIEWLDMKLKPVAEMLTRKHH